MSDTRGEACDTDAVIRRLAARQYGVVARAQLMAAGLAIHAIDYRVKRGRLQAIHRGVYQPGPVHGRYGREMAAVLACGETGLLSHNSASAFWGLQPPQRPDDRIEVAIRRGSAVRVPGLLVRRLYRLESDEWTVHEGIPVTVPMRTVLDHAGTIDARSVEQLLARADRLGLFDRKLLKELMKRYPRRAGRRSLCALLGTEVTLTRSEAEARFLELVRKAQFGAPQVNVMVRGFEVDFWWRTARLIVEVDGFAFHSSLAQFERDRRRDAILTAAGLRVMRIAWTQLVNEPEAVVARVAQALVRNAV